jgi:hypothetical protein
MAIAASIVTKEIAAAKATPKTMTDLAFQSNVNNSSFQPKPPQGYTTLDTYESVSVGVTARNSNNNFLESWWTTRLLLLLLLLLASLRDIAQQEAVLVVPETIAGIPYVSDSLIDNVQDGLVVMEEESERLIVDPLVLDDAESDIII